MVDDGIKDSYPGEWRIAGSARPPVGGILTVGEEIRLRTVRTLQGLAGDHDDFQDEAILGETPDGKITLLHCWSGASRTMQSGISDAETLAGVMLVGGRHWEDSRERKFDRLSFRLTGLNSWIGRRPFDDEHSQDSEAIQFTRPPDVPFPVPGGRAVIRRTQSSTLGVTIGSIESHEEIFIKLDRPQPFGDLYGRYVRPLRYFFDLATDEPCEASYITVANSKVLGSYDIPLEFSVRHPADHDPAYTRSIPGEMLFTLDSIDPTRLIPAWFTLKEELDPVCDLIFSLRERSRFYISTMAFTVASAAEGMHTRLFPDIDNNTAAHQARLSRIYDTLGENGDREWLEKKLQWSASLTYEQRLEGLAAYAGVAFAPYLRLRIARWSGRITNYRNIVAHSKDGLQDNPKHVIRLAATVELLLRIVLLRKLGFTDQECVRMIDRSRRWKHLRAVLPLDVPRVCSVSEQDRKSTPPGHKGT